MGADRPDDFDMPDFGDSSDSSKDFAEPRSRVAVEERDRSEYWEDLRAAVAADVWEAAAERFRGQWASHCGRWPASSGSSDSRGSSDSSDSPGGGRSGELPGAWRGDSGRYLDATANAEVEKRCEGIAEVERDVVSPAMREIEACDPGRRLVGFDHRLKGLDRIKDKVAAQLHDQPDMNVEEAFATVKDTLRFTFCYTEAFYTTGFQTDSRRLEDLGFMQAERRNTWGDTQYKGINSRWIEPNSGITFEVQFHTERSYEAKQLTHVTYERVRDPSTTMEERRELKALQRTVIEEVPLPRGVMTIPDHP